MFALSFCFAQTNGLPLNLVGTGVHDCPFRYKSKFFPRRTVEDACPYNKWGIWFAAILFGSHRFLWTVRQLVARTPCPYNVCGGRCAAILFVRAVGFLRAANISLRFMAHLLRKYVIAPTVRNKIRSVGEASIFSRYGIRFTHWRWTNAVGRQGIKTENRGTGNRRNL